MKLQETHVAICFVLGAMFVASTGCSEAPARKYSYDKVEKRRACLLVSFVACDADPETTSVSEMVAKPFHAVIECGWHTYPVKASDAAGFYGAIAKISEECDKLYRVTSVVIRERPAPGRSVWVRLQRQLDDHFRGRLVLPVAMVTRWPCSSILTESDVSDWTNLEPIVSN